MYLLKNANVLFKINFIDTPFKFCENTNKICKFWADGDCPSVPDYRYITISRLSTSIFETTIIILAKRKWFGKLVYFLLITFGMFCCVHPSNSVTSYCNILWKTEVKVFGCPRSRAWWVATFSWKVWTL